MMDEIKPHGVYTTEETSDVLRISMSTMKRLLKQGVIRANKVGGQYRILGKELIRVISPGAERESVRIYQKIKKQIKSTVKSW